MKLCVYPPLRPALDLALANSRQGGVVCYPTDTLYGLGGDATDPGVVKRIFELKGREGQRPFSVLFADWNMAKEYVEMGPALSKKLAELTPGPFTFLLPILAPLPATPGPLLGCRIPDHEFCLEWSKALGKPIVTTSANPSGQRAATCIEELDEEMAKNVSLIVDGGPTKQAGGSTIIDVPAKKIVREGAQAEKAKKWLESL